MAGARTLRVSEETVPDSTLGFTLSRKPIQRAYLRIRRKDGRVLVSAPIHLPLAQIHAFIRQHQDWIHTQQSQRNATVEPDFSRLWLWGEPLMLTWQYAGNRAQARRDGNTLHCVLPEGKTDASARQALLDRVLHHALSTAIEARLPVWCDRTGHPKPHVSIRRMRSRWGSCHITRQRISISLALAHYPPGCLDMVLVHELSHFDERGHNAHFYQKMDDYFPDWRRWDAMLRRPLSTEAEACAAPAPPHPSP